MSKEILLLGEFSTGKSAFINMLLGVSILPERLESTDMPIVKIHGQKPTGIFLREKGQKNPAILDNWNDIPSDWTMFDYAELTIPNHDLLSHRLIIWDTPGFNSTNSHHLKHLDDFLIHGHHNFQHIFFFVRENITKTSLDMLKKYKFNDKKVTVVVNIHYYLSVEDVERLFSNVKKTLVDHSIHYKSILLSINDLCDKFNELSATALHGEELSDWDLIKQWDNRKIDLNLLLQEFNTVISGKELFTMISETAQMQEKNDQWYQHLPIAELKGLADQGDSVAQYFYSVNQQCDCFQHNAVRYTTMSAQNGYGPAQFALALMYKNGLKDRFNLNIYVQKDISKYNSYLHLAIRNNVVEAIAESYFEGVGCEKNPRTGFATLQSAWNNGDVKVLGNIAECFQEGKGVDKNLEQAEKYYRLDAKNDIVAEFNLGVFLVSQNDTTKISEGISILKKLCSKIFLAKYLLSALFYGSAVQEEQKAGFEMLKKDQRNDGIVPYVLSKYYFNGIGTVQNFNMGFELLKKAYSIDGCGYIEFPDCYLEGRGTEKNTANAIRIYRDNIRKGHIHSKWLLGKLLMDDEKTLDEGRSLINEAAEDGDQDAITVMVSHYNKENPYLALQWLNKISYIDGASMNALYGEVYLNNEEYDKAVYYLEKAKAQDNVESINLLGVCASNGLGMAKDHIKAFNLFETAAQKGLSSAMNNLGLMYYEGSGVKKSIKLSNEWQTKAAEKGNENAMLTMGIRYIQGKEITKDEKKAFQLFEQLSERKNPEGYSWLGVMYKLGIYVDRDLLTAKKNLELAIEGGIKDSLEIYSEVMEELKKGPYARWNRTTHGSYYFEVNGESIALQTESQYISDEDKIIFIPKDNLYFICYDWKNKPADHWHEAEFIGTEDIVYYQKKSAGGDSFNWRIVDFQHQIDYNKVNRYWLDDDFIIQIANISYVIINHTQIEFDKIHPIACFEIKWWRNDDGSFYLMLNEEYLSGGRIIKNFRNENDLICVISEFKYNINLKDYYSKAKNIWQPAYFQKQEEKGFFEDLIDIFT